MQDDIKTPPQPQQGENPGTSAQPVQQKEDNTPSPTQEKPTESPAQTAKAPVDQINPPLPKESHKNHHIVPVVLAVIILIALAGVAIIAGMQEKESDQNVPVQQTDTESDLTQDQTTVNESVESIDNLPPEDDTSGEGLSDQNLGL